MTDHMIGQALGDMIRGLALKHLQYNTPHWCYINIANEPDSELLRALDKNFFSVSPVTQFVCCSYKIFQNECQLSKCTCV